MKASGKVNFSMELGPSNTQITVITKETFSMAFKRAMASKHGTRLKGSSNIKDSGNKAKWKAKENSRFQTGKSMWAK